MGLAVLPSGLLLLLQFLLLFGNNSDSSIAFGLSAWSQSALLDFIPFSIIFGMLFPLYVTIINIKKLDTPYALALTNAGIATFIYAFIYETGPRMQHGNMGWTYLFAMFFMFFQSSKQFFGNPPKNKYLLLLGYVLFGVHLLSGCFYFVKVILGLDFA